MNSAGGPGKPLRGCPTRAGFARVGIFRTTSQSTRAPITDSLHLSCVCCRHALGTEAVPAGPRAALRDLQLLSAAATVGIGARQAPLRGRAGAGAPSVWILRHRLRDYAGTRAPVAQRT